MPGTFRYPIETELAFERKLHVVAKAAAGVVMSFVDGHELVDEQGLRREVAAYSARLDRWANKAASHFLREVDEANLRSWDRALGVSFAPRKRKPKPAKGITHDAAPTGIVAAQSQVSLRTVGRNLRTHFARSVIGLNARQLHEQQVDLITSLPTEAGLRAIRMARQAELDSTRASYVARELARTEEVTLNRATLIARTEIAKANWTLTKARAEYVGATHYYWRTMEDEDVRDAHAAVDGMVFAFDDPPDIEGEGVHGPGDFPNCRCYPEPIIDRINAPAF